MVCTGHQQRRLSRQEVSPESSSSSSRIQAKPLPLECRLQCLEFNFSHFRLQRLYLRSRSTLQLPRNLKCNTKREMRPLDASRYLSSRNGSLLSLSPRAQRKPSTTPSPQFSDLQFPKGNMTDQNLTLSNVGSSLAVTVVPPNDYLSVLLVCVGWQRREAELFCVSMDNERLEE